MEASDAFGYSDCWTMVPFPETGNGAGGASQAAEIKSSVLGISMVGVQHIFLRIEKLRSVINSHAFFFFFKFCAFILAFLFTWNYLSPT